ncbi:Cu(I)-responsive transcriptional regulator [Falsochrobactrum ovis]|uniref:MerR family transcriptional regulator n=1 Tax=Falsochrobactrum ovis TaxID=1293442 RepID=A0A364JZG5_9HYPH|nr:Cu(I)-responsive transcriptional regulator [Falsochrobactrum ovis]RAK34106.1 MerR family transcriptional regulator [Falsochrobactrum ovis]
MNIGQAAAASGISAKMIRHYESIGLIDEAERSSAGYRIYTRKDLETLRFIRSSRDLGFSVDQIRELLALWRDRNRASADVKRVALGHVAELEAKMRQLQEMADTLRHLAAHCHGDDRPDCPIIQQLADPCGEVSVTPRKGELLRTLS